MAVKKSKKRAKAVGSKTAPASRAPAGPSVGDPVSYVHSRGQAPVKGVIHKLHIGGYADVLLSGGLRLAIPRSGSVGVGFDGQCWSPVA